jgi:septation ring formation regulator EzrA
MGYRAAYRKARRDLYQMADRFDDAIDEVRAEMEAAREEFDRYKAVEAAIAVERDFDTLLH